MAHEYRGDRRLACVVLSNDDAEPFRKGNDKVLNLTEISNSQFPKAHGISTKQTLFFAEPFIFTYSSARNAERTHFATARIELLHSAPFHP